MSTHYKLPRHFGKVEILAGDGSGRVYLRRWYLFRCKYFSFRLHHLLLPDLQRDPHDHPWWFLSAVLRGGYTERWAPEDLAAARFHPPVRGHDFGGPLTKQVRWFSFHRHTDFHQIARFNNGRDAWTLVITGRERRKWGFLTDQGRVPWDQYEEAGSHQ